MKELDNIYSVVKEITEITDSPNFVTEFQNLARFRTATAAPTTFPSIIDAVNKLEGILTSVDLSLWTADHQYVLEKLGVINLVGHAGKEYFESIKSLLTTNPSNVSAIVTSLYTNLSNFRTKPKQFLNLLKDFNLSYNIETIDVEEGVLEIVFDGKVEIEDFKEAKDQMNDWFIIIEGYCRLLGVTREQFQIISISKNSPVKFKVKTTLANVTAVLGIITSVFTIQQIHINNQLLLEQLKKTQMDKDGDAQKQIIENWEHHLNEKIDDRLEKLVEKKLDERKVEEERGEVKNALSKSVRNQYNFIVNGGTVNVKVIDPNVLQQVEKLEKTKETIKEIQAPFLNQKSLEEGSLDDDI